MIRLTRILQEIGEGTAKPFPWKYHADQNGMGDFEYSFETDNGTRYNVTITMDDYNQWEVGFSAYDGSYHSHSVLTGVGALRVMATITQIMKDFLTNTYTKHIADKELYWGDTHPKTILFSAHKEKEDREDGRRAALYKAFIQKQLPGTRVSVVRSGADMTWYSVKLPRSLQPKKPRR